MQLSWSPSKEMAFWKNQTIKNQTEQKWKVVKKRLKDQKVNMVGKFILNIFCQLDWKDENKEKEAGNGPFFKKIFEGSLLTVTWGRKTVKQLDLYPYGCRIRGHSWPHNTHLEDFKKNMEANCNQNHFPVSRIEPNSKVTTWIAKWSSHSTTMNIGMLRPGPWGWPLVTTILFRLKA